MRLPRPTSGRRSSGTAIPAASITTVINSGKHTISIRGRRPLCARRDRTLCTSTCPMASAMYRASSPQDVHGSEAPRPCRQNGLNVPVASSNTRSINGSESNSPRQTASEIRSSNSMIVYGFKVAQTLLVVSIGMRPAAARCLKEMPRRRLPPRAAPRVKSDSMATGAERPACRVPPAVEGDEILRRDRRHGIDAKRHRRRSNERCIPYGDATLVR
jgi:hypothetical protein